MPGPPKRFNEAALERRPAQPQIVLAEPLLSKQEVDFFLEILTGETGQYLTDREICQKCGIQYTVFVSSKYHPAYTQFVQIVNRLREEAKQEARDVIGRAVALKLESTAPEDIEFKDLSIAAVTLNALRTPEPKGGKREIVAPMQVPYVRPADDHRVQGAGVQQQNYDADTPPSRVESGPAYNIRQDVFGEDETPSHHVD